MKFFVTISREMGAEVTIEAPSAQALAKFLDTERADEFQDWFLESDDFEVSVLDLKGEGLIPTDAPPPLPDMTLNEAGEQID